MSTSPSDFQKWTDSEFMKRGAFLTTTDNYVFFGKGGEITYSDELVKSKKCAFYLKDFYSDRFLVYSPESILKISKVNVLKWIETEKVNHYQVSPVENDDEIYQKDFNLLMDTFGEELEKVVLVSRETYGGFHQDQTIRHLLKRSFEMHAGWPYGIWNESFGMIGSTPELLYEVKNKTLSTFALAGTAPVGQEAELLNSTKDRHEHDLVIKDIREKLKDFTSDLAVYETELLTFKTMVHLKTDIVGKIKTDMDFTKLTITLSPTAALGGYPKESSLKFLRNSHYSRKYQERYFGSCLGVMSDDYSGFVVAIRNVQWKDQKLFIESGGGVVPESEFQKELEEVHLKRNTIRNNYL